MNPKRLFLGIALHCALAFVVGAAVTYLYSLVAHGQGTTDWRMALQLALVLGISLPLAGELTQRRS